MALNEFEGTVMLVSHDRALLRSVCDEFWLVGSGVVEPFDGDLDDYQKYLLDMAKQRRESLSAKMKADAQAKNAKAATAVPVAIESIATHAVSITVSGQNSLKNEPEGIFKSKEQRQQEARERAALAEKAKPFKNQLVQIESRITALQTERALLHDKLTQPLANPDLIEANKRLALITSELEDCEWKWLGLSEQMDALQTA